MEIDRFDQARKKVKKAIQRAAIKAAVNSKGADQEEQKIKVARTDLEGAVRQVTH